MKISWDREDNLTSRHPLHVRQAHERMESFLLPALAMQQCIQQWMQQKLKVAIAMGRTNGGGRVLHARAARPLPPIGRATSSDSILGKFTQHVILSHGYADLFNRWRARSRLWKLVRIDSWKNVSGRIWTRARSACYAAFPYRSRVICRANITLPPCLSRFVIVKQDTDRIFLSDFSSSPLCCS